ncbi:hypothetical protein [Streptomyces sp. NPDC059080]|uniref:hypothetical protein n=1 Tax=Streptomyces sp. NPDC059080 TaxID=3346718 RepID=UPI0036AF08B2
MSDEQPSEREEILLKHGATEPYLKRGGDTLLLAQFAYSWKNHRGEDTSSINEVLLRPAGEHDEPATAKLPAVDFQVSPENLESRGQSGVGMASHRVRAAKAVAL